jgi:hypothetical protein
MSTDTQFPILIWIIRHAEKPGDPDGEDGGPNLSVLGSARAAALPTLFAPDPTQSPATLPQLTCDLATGAEGEFSGVYGNSTALAGPSRRFPPDFLFATASSSSSSRPLETITPTVQALQFLTNNPKLTINQQFGNDTDGINGLVKLVLSGAPYAGKVVLICWHHGTIPQLTEAFGVPASQLPFSKWPSTVFDLVFGITFPSGQANLGVTCQKLLYGDSSTPPGQSN